MNSFLGALVISTSVLTLLGLVLGDSGRFGQPGRALCQSCEQAPGLDLLISLLTWIPWVLAALLGGWWAFAGVVLGQLAALRLWGAIHELAHREAARGPRIVKVLNSLVGPWRNQAALWVTTVVLPVFLLIRLSQIILYPLLIWLVGFPHYRHGEWINVSRHKFKGLVGGDLIWCLYCDWMTGVYCFGAEILRNVESFWCPTRFHNEKKCENCRFDFPDIDHGWVGADASMADVERLMLQKYGGRHHSWFGHPERKAEDDSPAAPPEG